MTALVRIQEFFAFIISLFQDIFSGFLGIFSGEEDSAAE